jgi:hypothetical protein
MMHGRKNIKLHTLWVVYRQGGLRLVTGNYWRITIKAMFVYRKMEARSYNQFCSGKAISITYSECV